MRKISYKLLLVIAVAVAIESCKKSDSNNTTTTNVSVVGFWSGSGVQSGTGTTQKAAIVFKSDGKMRFYNTVSATTDTAALAAANKSDGTYTVSGTTLTSTYTLNNVLLLLSATVNSAGTSMTGTAGISPASAGVGTFTFAKQ